VIGARIRPGGVQVAWSGDRAASDRLTIEREKGFEPSTSTLARGFRPNDFRGFADLKVQNGAAWRTSVV